MSNTKPRAVAESVFKRNQRREAEINDALKQEAARRAAAVKNMHRLRALRLAREAKANNQWKERQCLSLYSRTYRARFRLRLLCGNHVARSTLKNI